MAGHETRWVSITNLLVDPENPRHDIVESQRDAIQTMLEDQREKLLRLAEDIIEAGPNPSELLIVIPYSGDKNRFVVLEGNRRVTALKILEAPSILSGKTSESLRKKFGNLSAQYNANPIETLQCVVFPNRESANRWIDLKHTGENQGVGVVPWGAKEVARFNERRGKKSRALQVIDFVERNAKLDSETRKKLGGIAVTNLTRLLNDPYVRDFLGVKIVDDNIQTDLTKKEVLKGLTRIAGDLAHKRINVNDIRFQKDREDYIEKFKATDIPDHSKRSGKSWRLESDADVPNKRDAEKKKRRSKPVFPRRKSLIPSNCIIKIDDRRINSIYRELKHLNLDDYRNAGAILFRVFIELSIDSFIENKSLSIHQDSNLKKKVQAVIKHFQKNRILTKDQLKPINTAISSPNSVFSIDTFHALVHNRFSYAKPDESKLAWDELQTFMEKLWV